MKRFVLLVAVVVFSGFAGLIDANAKGKGTSSKYNSYKGGKTIDGDTFRYKGERYRIQQYNAPEIGQPGSKKATGVLQKKLDSGKYEWKAVARDVYGRPIVNEREK